jgi:hypothetical protein
MRRKACLVSGIVFIFFCFACVSIAETPPPLNVKKHTVAGKYATAQEAFEMWKANPDKITIIHCRTQEIAVA